MNIIIIIITVAILIISLAIKLLYNIVDKGRRDVARQLRDCIEMRDEYVPPVNEAIEVLDPSRSDISSKEVCINVGKGNNKGKDYNSCVMIKRSWNDYRYLDKLLDKGQRNLFTGKVLYIYVSKYSNEIIMNPNVWHYNPVFYISADRLRRIDRYLYEELLKVHESFTYKHSQSQMGIIHQFFNKLTYTGVEDIDNLISKGRGVGL